MKMKIKTWAHFKGEIPAYQSLGASGFDVRAQLEGGNLILKKGERALVPTALSFEIPLGYEIQARPRSGWHYSTARHSPREYAAGSKRGRAAAGC